VAEKEAGVEALMAASEVTPTKATPTEATPKVIM
jgi:hypothetical protein